MGWNLHGMEAPFRYVVRVSVNNGEYKYTKRLDMNCGIGGVKDYRSYATEEEAKASIDEYMEKHWPHWDSGRNSLFRSHCFIEAI